MLESRFFNIANMCYNAIRENKILAEIIQIYFILVCCPNSLHTYVVWPAPLYNGKTSSWRDILD